jgi:hypothetical protein
MSLTIIAPPTGYPVTRTEAKEHLRLALDDISEDWLVDLMIAAATKQAEKETNRSLLPRTLRLVVYADSATGIRRYLSNKPMSEWPYYSGYAVELPRPPFISITSAKLIDAEGDETPLTEDDYVIDQVPLVPVFNAKRAGSAETILIEYTAGYAIADDDDETETAAAVPADIKKWMLCYINTMYEFREKFIAGTFDSKPSEFIDGLLDDYRIVSAH